jgi:hypothetical protein
VRLQLGALGLQECEAGSAWYFSLSLDGVWPMQEYFRRTSRPRCTGSGALLGLVSLNVSMLLLGSVLLEAARGVGVLALLSGIVGLVALVLFISRRRLSESC